jgi:hypothetical protein
MRAHYIVGLSYWVAWMLFGWGAYAFVRWVKWHSADKYMSPPKLYVVTTNTFGAKRWQGPGGGLVSDIDRAERMPLERAQRFVRIPTCSPIVDWAIEEAP